MTTTEIQTIFETMCCMYVIVLLSNWKGRFFIKSFMCLQGLIATCITSRKSLSQISGPELEGLFLELALSCLCCAASRFWDYLESKLGSIGKKLQTYHQWYLRFSSSSSVSLLLCTVHFSLFSSSSKLLHAFYPGFIVAFSGKGKIKYI
jgi:hypothetical protein